MCPRGIPEPSRGIAINNVLGGCESHATKEGIEHVGRKSMWLGGKDCERKVNMKLTNTASSKSCM